ncbi:MAG: shikimate dehydrogenase family protein [Actinomycetota bacterium]
MPDSLTALSGATRVAGLIGSPTQVHFSLSPAIHNAAFRALALDWVYVGFPVEEGDAIEAVRGLRSAGASGLNVTTPHKVPAASAVDRLEGTAAAVGAVNTVEMREGELVGWNTDGDGLVRFLGEDAGVSLSGAAALVLGAGGTARSIVAALAAAGVASITAVARDPLRAEALRGPADPVPFAAPGTASRSGLRHEPT